MYYIVLECHTSKNSPLMAIKILASNICVSSIPARISFLPSNDGEDAVGGEGGGDGVAIHVVGQREAPDEAQSGDPVFLLPLRLPLHQELLSSHQLHCHIPAGEVVDIHNNLLKKTKRAS